MWQTGSITGQIFFQVRNLSGRRSNVAVLCGHFQIKRVDKYWTNLGQFSEKEMLG